MNPTRSNAETPADSPGALLSALADGDPAVLPQACQLWRDDAQARRTWHTYHLIGDVMRSDELARPVAGDAAFLAALRERLAREPVVLAPSAPVMASRRGAWRWPTALAAGFVAVAGLLVVSRLSEPALQADAPVVAIGTPAPATIIDASDRALSPRPLVIEGRMLRDARLDSYLRAHREALGGIAAVAPDDQPRAVDTLAVEPR
jgi:sigma-E factor negative regulatory protein RseA